MSATEIRLEKVPIEEFLDKITEFTNNIPTTPIVTNDDIKSRGDIYKYIQKKQRNEDDNCNMTQAQWDHFNMLLRGEIQKVRRNYRRVEAASFPSGIDIDYILKKTVIFEVDTVKEVLEKYKFKLHTCMQRIWITGGIPEQWKEGRVTPKYKSFALDKSRVTSFSPYFTPNVIYRVWARILVQELNQEIKTKKITAPGQVQWSRGVVEADVTFTLRKLIQKEINDLSGKLYVFFVQLQDPLAHVIWDSLFEKMRTYEINAVLISRIEEIYKETIYKWENQKFWASRGLKYGCPLSVNLFNIYIADLEKWLQDGNTDPIQFGNLKLTALYNTREIAILAKTEADLVYLMQRFDKYLMKEGFNINVGESKVVLFSQGGVVKSDMNWKCGWHAIDSVTKYRFIGYTFTSDGTDDIKIQKSVEEKEKNLEIIKTIDRELVATHFSDWMTLYNTFIHFNLPLKWCKTPLGERTRKTRLDFVKWLFNLPNSTSDDEVEEFFKEHSYVKDNEDTFHRNTCVTELVNVFKRKLTIQRSWRQSRSGLHS